jgi:hypothetical protein
MRISVAVMALLLTANGRANFDEIRNFCPTSKANIWSVDVNGDRFAITPAHEALFAKDNVRYLSPFLEDLGDGILGDGIRDLRDVTLTRNDLHEL